MSQRSKSISSQLNQTAVYWANPIPDGSGSRTFDDGVEIDVRWEERTEIFIDSAGREVRSNAIVYVNVDVSNGEYLYLGGLDDLASDEEGDPLIVTGAYEIRQFQKIPSIDGTKFVRKVMI